MMRLFLGHAMEVEPAVDAVAPFTTRLRARRSSDASGGGSGAFTDDARKHAGAASPAQGDVQLPAPALQRHRASGSDCAADRWISSRRPKHALFVVQRTPPPRLMSSCPVRFFRTLVCRRGGGVRRLIVVLRYWRDAPAAAAP